MSIHSPFLIKSVLVCGVLLCALTPFVNVHAAVGDAYIARAGSGSLITNLNDVENTLTYDTEVKTSSDITRQTGNQAFRIQNSGRYLIITNTSFDYNDIGNNNRHVVRTTIKVGGTALSSVYGMASGYGRDSGNAAEDGVVTVAYIDHTVSGGSADDITIHVQNLGDTASTDAADQFANRSGIQIIRLPDDSEYLQVRRTSDITFTGTLGYSTADPTWNEFGWENEDAETDNSIIEWVSGNDVTLKEAGHYLVIYSIYADSPSGRKGATYRLKLDDTEVPASRVVSYMRRSNGANDAWVQWAGFIEASANDVLNIDWGSASETAGGALDEATMTVVKFPDTADYVRVRYDANRAGETTGAYPFNQEDEDDAGVHDNATNNSRISGDSDEHDWLLFASWFARTTAVDSARVAEHFRWYRSGTEVQYGSGLSYHRGDQSTTGVPAGGRIAAIVADSLGLGEYMELNLRHEASGSDENRDFIADQVGITGVALDTLVPAGTLTVDIVDSGGDSVSSPSMTMAAVGASITSQTATGVFGVSGEKIRVQNGTANDQWTLTVAAQASTDLWDGSSDYYDFNDGSGASDGGDTDSYGGQMSVDAATNGVITPEGGCSSSNLTLGSEASFEEGTTDSITILSAGSGADTSCYWDVTGVDIDQLIPAEQSADTYSIDMVLTVTAS